MDTDLKNFHLWISRKKNRTINNCSNILQEYSFSKRYNKNRIIFDVFAGGDLLILFLSKLYNKYRFKVCLFPSNVVWTILKSEISLEFKSVWNFP